MRVAVLGAGRIGAVHARLVGESAGVDEVLVADVDRVRAEALAAEVGGAATDEPQTAIERADAVIVATPPSTHSGLVRAAVARGLPVLCEKPLTDDLEAAELLASFVRQSHGLVLVAFQRRFDPAYRAALERLRSGRLGELYLMRLTATEPVRPRSSKTNLLRNTAIHDFDAVRWLSGCEVASVYAEGSDRRGGRFDTSADPDTVSVTLRLTDGTLASVSVSRLSPLGYDVRLELVGSSDHVATGWSSRTPVHSLEPGGEAGEGAGARAGTAAGAEVWRDWESRFEAAYRSEVTAFLGVARGGATGDAATVGDGVAAQRIVDAARRSLDEGRRIDLAPPAAPGRRG